MTLGDYAEDDYLAVFTNELTISNRQHCAQLKPPVFSLLRGRF